MVSEVVSEIMSQPEVTDFITTGTVDVPIDEIFNMSGLEGEGEYWELLKDLAIRSGSIPVLYTNEFNFIPREPIGAVVWNFRAAGLAAGVL